MPFLRLVMCKVQFHVVTESSLYTLSSHITYSEQKPHHVSSGHLEEGKTNGNYTTLKPKVGVIAYERF